MTFAHYVLPFETDEEFLASAVPFLDEGLEAGLPSLVVTRQDNVDLLHDTLGRDAKKILFFLSDGWYLHPPRTISAYNDFMREHDSDKVQIIGEPVWYGRDPREVREWTRYEAMVNRAFTTSGSRVACMYDARIVAPEVLADAMRTHPLLLTRGGETINDRYVVPEDLVLDGDAEPFGAPPETARTMSFSLRELKNLRDFVTYHALRAGLPRNRTSSLVLGVAEIANNAVEHGSGHGAAYLWTDDGEFVCEIVDPAGTAPSRFPGYVPPVPEAPRGYGMWITRQLCDLMEIRVDALGYRVRLRMRVP
ncbi:sensor histidine kinase [Rhizohabitans arisaemae]|uniref:sensor histidine kinase n=1 Tax=Rhizohabitans arisaemae TaxID=2720610 RepID=UPI0024B15833|nr:sensor histidine kinase [Rhizohabitans arisaemae]